MEGSVCGSMVEYFLETLGFSTRAAGRERTKCSKADSSGKGGK